MRYLFFKVGKEDIAMIKHLLEAYENIMALSTIGEAREKIQISIADDFLADAQDILADMATRFSMEPINDPIDISQGNY